MAVKKIIQKGLYFDSLKLMGISARISDMPGVKQGVVAMATMKNKEMLRNFNLLDEELESLANGDLMIVINADTEDSCDKALELAQELISGNLRNTTNSGFSSLNSTVQHVPEANLVVISVPGMYAAKEARKALESDLHVMMFSDNVSIEDEVVLKQFAHENGLLMMGPDCGTAIIANVALCFANQVRPGNIGLVGASGTGGQEVTSLIHNLGGGITHYIGTGGRDLSLEVGGIMMLDALDALAADESSEILVLISKPPVPSVEEVILKRAAESGKPVVVCFINGSRTSSEYANLHFVGSLEQAAVKAMELAKITPTLILEQIKESAVQEAKPALKAEQKFIRGLYTGGTLCGESMYLAKQYFQDVNSNLIADPSKHIASGEPSKGHTFIDYGEDEYTDGKPHPMIDPSQRNKRIEEEANDPQTAVILMDFVIGFGSHKDPVGATLPSIQKAKEIAASAGRTIAFIGYVCGTPDDFQGYDQQREQLTKAGVIVADSNAQAARMAVEICK